MFIDQYNYLGFSRLVCRRWTWTVSSVL